MSDVPVEVLAPGEAGAVAAPWRDMEGAVELVRAYLEAAVPVYAELLAEQATPLARVPSRYTAGPTDLRAEELPEVNVVPLEVGEVLLVDASRAGTPAAHPSVATPNPPVGSAWWVTYELRVYWRVRGQEYADTYRELTRLGKAIRLALLADLRLGSDERVGVDPSSLTSSYSDVDRSGGRAIAAGYTAVRVRLEETLSYGTQGIAGALTVTPSLLPHPALT